MKNANKLSEVFFVNGDSPCSFYVLELYAEFAAKEIHYCF